MIYLASVYSYRPLDCGDDQLLFLMSERAEYAAKRCAELMISEVDKSVFSPITHCHQMALDYGLPKEWDFWKEVDEGFIDKSDNLYVLMMPHWESSVGITAEIRYAHSLGIPVVYLSCPDYPWSD